MMDNSIKALGLMSGTSLDGIDASILQSDGEENIEIIDNKYLKYPDHFREKLYNYIEKNSSKEDILKSKEEYEDIQRELTIIHSSICLEIIENYSKQIDLIGFHGQTIIHKPNLGYTIQMGDPKLLSQLLKHKVIFNFRKNDILNNGEGAPLSPIYHFNLCKKLKFKGPCLFLNIGGISNITYCDKKLFFAKDIGPGNVLIDEFLKKTKKINFDKNGEIASSGSVDKYIVNQFIKHEIYKSKEKHSYDRSEFDFNFIKGLKFENAVATLTFFTATIISNYINQNFNDKLHIILCGGGRKNLALIKYIKDLTKQKILKIDNFGIDGDFIESQAFAYLAIRSFLKKYLTYPSTTKVSKPVSGGEIFENF